MNQPRNQLRITVLTAALALAWSVGAGAADVLSSKDYKAAKNTIAAEYKSARAACDSKSANAKDVCIAEAKGHEKVAKAELDERNKPGDKAHRAVGIVKAEAAYAVSREKCDEKAGAEKTACVTEAKSVEARAKADANAPMKTSSSSEMAKPASTTAARAKADANAPMKDTGANEMAKPASTTAATRPASAKETPVEYVEDAVITTKVKAAVLGERSLKSAEINVETLKGTVQLTGFVRSRADINRAVEVAKSVKGVKEVKNDMILKGAQ